MTREQIIEALQQHVCQVDFNKVNGDFRSMKCTLIKSYIPDDKRPKSNKEYSTETVRAFDLAKQEWRSFRVDKVIGILQY